jgi:hypothetical protein
VIVKIASEVKNQTIAMEPKSQVLSTKHKTLFLARPIKGNIIAKESGANGTREFENPSVATEDQQQRRIETERIRLDCVSASLFVHS